MAPNAKAIEKQIRTLRATRKTLRDEVRQLRSDVAEAKATFHSYAIRQWHQSRLDVDLIASGEPGVIAATSRLTTPSGVFAATKDFHILTICHSLPHLSPVTQNVWRDIVGNAAMVLDANAHRRTPIA